MQLTRLGRTQLVATVSRRWLCTDLEGLDATSDAGTKASANIIGPKFHIDKVRQFHQNNVMGKRRQAPIYAASSEGAATTRRRQFRMVLPPPNVTGNLHIGHALTVAVEDALCRYQRQIGDEVIWYPGFDHAGIATQTVIEKNLYKQGLRRQDMTRQKFVQRCTTWKNSRVKEITEQLLRMGCDLDWERMFYTMDERFSHAVTTAFRRLYDQGLIFRAERTVNWCPLLESVVSDQEVEEVNGVKVCTRSGGVIEQVSREQWFLNCDEMHSDVMKALDEGVFKIKPDFCAKSLAEWLKYKEPWCLSRQLYWGHQVPAFQLVGTDRWVVAGSIEEARSLLGVDERAEVRQDEDVLDTWFSSSLIPLCVAGWPNSEIEGEVLELMETGVDIIGFWVARMLTIGKRLTGHFPFTNILLHGMVRDNEGRKMSKSLGNIIDPLDVIDGVRRHDMVVRSHKSLMSKNQRLEAEAYIVRKYPLGIACLGADALRFAFFRHKVTQLDVSLEIGQWAEEGRRFCNKLWNVVRYTQYVIRTYAELLEEGEGQQHRAEELAAPDTPRSAHVPQVPQKVASEDTLLRERFDEAKRVYHTQMREHELHLAFDAIYAFFERDLCDVYVEATKAALQRRDGRRLAEVLRLLREIEMEAFHILSVFMPMISAYLLDVLDRSAAQILDEKRDVKSHCQRQEELFSTATNDGGATKAAIHEASPA